MVPSMKPKRTFWNLNRNLANANPVSDALNRLPTTTTADMKIEFKK
ncbi:hypothetical protein AAC03nite_11410 [Alicyclobacillus acidoterrestris]|nr:hypothetical protein AAC03nite_11410 [Alicyclobacillus acidoterrestris]